MRNLNRFHPNWQRNEPGSGGTAENLETEAGETVRDLARSARARFQTQKRSAIETVNHALRDRVTGSIDRAADYLVHQDPRNMLRDVEGFARRRPGLFVAAAFCAGILAGRFLKSSSRRSTSELGVNYGRET